MSRYWIPAKDDFLENFPFPSIRDKQMHVLNEICDSFNSGYKYIILEAPTGFGKSPVAIAVAMTLGSSHICTSTKDLQTQYSKDFPYVKLAKGKNNFPCLVKEDLIRNGKYNCGTCTLDDKCYHTTVEYGPCITDNAFKETGCKYFPKDYKIINRGTKDEQIFLDDDAIKSYQNEYSEWVHIRNLKDQKEWRPCQYFDQLNIARISSHSVYNYSMFLSLLPLRKAAPNPRELLVLDEGHLLEQEIVKFTGFSISKRKWKRYIHDFNINDYGYDDIEKWIEFLIDLETKMLRLAGDTGTPIDLAKHRREETGWLSKTSDQNKEITDNHEEEQREIVSEYQDALKQLLNFSNELAREAAQDLEKLTLTIYKILYNKKNWIVSEIKKDNYNDIAKVELKPLDVSSYCKPVFDKCSKTLIMSATILDVEAFCRTIGLNPNEVKFIQVESDFPLENRPISPLSIAYLNYSNLQSIQVQSSITRAIDNIMTLHKHNKGIIHTTSYEQLNFIKNNISKTNAQRLLETDPEIQRDQVIEQHINSVEASVLISPSLHTGLDLKDDLSRFQIITKVPYPNIADRWTNAKRKIDKDWYYWQTALKIIQAYGRSIRSKEDWAKTYVLDSGFISFVAKNASTLPNWFKQAIEGGGRNYSSIVDTTSKTILEESLANPEEIRNYVKKDISSLQKEKAPTYSQNLLNFLELEGELDKENIVYTCYYCNNFKTSSKRDYEFHGVHKHPGKPLYT